MEKLKTYLAFFSIRRNLIFLGLLFILLAIAATTYLALQQQELRKRAVHGGPHASISGPSSGQIGQVLTYSATANGTRLTGMEIFVSPTSSQQWQRIGGTAWTGQGSPPCGFSSSCTISGSWSPSAQGQYYVVVNAYSDSNGDNQINGINENCSGNPFSLTPGWTDCGPNDLITVTIGNPPTASMSVNGISTSGPVNINVNAPARFDATANGTNLKGMEIFRARTTADLTQQSSWTRIAGSPTACSGGSSCTISDSWTPTQADVGDWHTAVNAYSDQNGDGDTNDPGENCTGNPAFITPGWVDCSRDGGIDSILIRVVAPLTPTATPPLTPTPTSVAPTPTHTPTPTPGGPTPTPGGPTPTSGPIPTVTPGGPTPTGIPPGSTALSISANLEGFPGTYTPTRKTEPIEVDLLSATATISGKKGIVTYSGVSRHFDGIVILGTDVLDDVYTLFVKGTSYLRRNLGTITIKSQATNFVPFLPDKPLLSCDLNNDNIVNILDIGQVYTDIKKVVKDSLADIDRDGDIDIFDHNFCVQNFLKKGDELALQ